MRLTYLESRDEGCSGSPTLAKAPILLGRNAKTRWGEPAGQFAWSQVVNVASVEAEGRSRNGADNCL